MLKDEHYDEIAEENNRRYVEGWTLQFGVIQSPLKPQNIHATAVASVSCLKDLFQSRLPRLSTAIE